MKTVFSPCNKLSKRSKQHKLLQPPPPQRLLLHLPSEYLKHKPLLLC